MLDQPTSAANVIHADRLYYEHVNRLDTGQVTVGTGISNCLNNFFFFNIKDKEYQESSCLFLLCLSQRARLAGQLNSG